MSILTVIIGLMIMTVLIVIYKPRMRRAGEISKETGVISDKWLYQGINGIKEAKITGSERKFIQNYAISFKEYLEAERFHSTANVLPQLIVETVFVSVIVFYIMFQVVSGIDILAQVPTYTAFAVAAIRLMPSINGMNSNYNSISYFRTYIYDVST